MRMSIKRCSRMEWLPHEVVECILERLPVKYLVRFKAVSKQWRSTIESRLFQERQLRHRQKSGGPDVLMRSDDPYDVESLRTLELGSSSPVEIPSPWENDDVAYSVCQSSCDGLVCLYDIRRSVFVVNPATRWYRALPLCRFQQLTFRLGHRYYKLGHTIPTLAFGKDKFTGTYKVVWLYNSAEIDLKKATTCEVFDFRSSVWRYITRAAPYPVVGYFTDPAYVDGSLYWFTDCHETKVVSLDLHTEAFQVLSKAPFGNGALSYQMVMCNLHDRLCVSVNTSSSSQLFWSFNSANRTWDKMFSLDLEHMSLWSDITRICALVPLALLDAEDKKKKRLLFRDRYKRRTLRTVELDTLIYHHAFTAHESVGYPICYFPSLISI